MKLVNIFTFFVIAVLLVACSSSEFSPVVIPDYNRLDQTITADSSKADLISDAILKMEIPLSGVSNDISGRTLMGIYTLHFNESNLELTTHADRSLMAHHNVTSFLPAPLLEVIRFNQLTGIMDVNATITNTFAIDGYDLRLIVYTDSAGSRLKNADNWTELFDIPGGAMINPFKAYSNSGENRIFRGDSSHTQMLQVYFPAGYEQVNYAIEASHPGNCAEPYEIKNFTQNKDLYQEIGSSATIGIDVYDWQDDVSSVELFCPAITGEAFVTMTNVHSTRWEMTLENTTGASAGNYLAFIRAKSEGSDDLSLYADITIRVKSSTGYGQITGEITSHECPITGHVDGRFINFAVTAKGPQGGESIVLYEIDWNYDGETFNTCASNENGSFMEVGPFVNENCPDDIPVYYEVAFRATDNSQPPNVEIFATCEVVVDQCCGLITGNVQQPSCPINGVVSGKPFDIKVNATSGNDGGDITLYEADWNYDGETFTVDAISNDGWFRNVEFLNPNCPASNPYFYNIAFRATDSCNPPNQTIFRTCQVSVEICCGPISGSIIEPLSLPVTNIYDGQKLSFRVSASSANGGNPIISYQADWNYDGNFTVDAFNSSGIFEDIVFTNPNCPSSDPFTYNVAFRAVDICNPPNSTVFATCEVIIDDCLGFFGNLKINVNRSSSNEFGYPIDTVGPWTLSWGPHPDALQYAIYCDFNPDDGLTNDLELVGVTENLSYPVPDYHLNENRYVHGNTYIVKYRTVFDEPSSEAGESEPAFIMVNGFETVDDNSNDGEGWFGNCERNVSNYNHRFHVVSNSKSAHGDKSIMLPHYSGFTNRWLGITKQTPDIPDSSVRYLECSVYYDAKSAPNTGLFFGTSSIQPSYGWSNTSQMQWASVNNIDYYKGYNVDFNDVRTFFTGVSSGLNSWRVSESPHIYVFSGDLNIDGNPNHPYVAIEFLHREDPIVADLEIDEIAIVIY